MEDYHPPKDRINMIDYNSFNPCVGMSFLLTSNEEFIQLKNTFHKIITEYSGSFFTDQNFEDEEIGQINDLPEQGSYSNFMSSNGGQKKTSEDDFELIDEKKDSSYDN